MADYFWAKTTQDNKPGKSVEAHMRDVQSVANIMLDGKEGLLVKYGLKKESIAAFAGLHDIGKVSPGFQSKCGEWLRQSGLERIARNNAWDTYEVDHAKITQYTMKNILQKNNMTTESAEFWSALLGAHHGWLNRLGATPKGCKPDDEWENKREKIAGDFIGTTISPDFAIDNTWPLAWWLAGLVSVADWVGSNEEYFSPEKVDTTLKESTETANTAFKAIGFDRIDLLTGLSLGDIFKDEEDRAFLPNDLQIKAGENIRRPGLYVIEAPMGMGKTEAAFWVAYNLMCEKKASGVYFALPTQATSNRIYLRMQKFCERISKTTVEAKLIHANSWLLDNIRVPRLRADVALEKETVQEAKDWFASKKRALLAPFGVGTIDQALMSIIAVKHFFVRQFALAGKVIILDEVHSYDLYTGTLIRTLCDRLLPLGCTILILSATLSRQIKKRFIDVAGVDDNSRCPLITGKAASDEDKPVSVLIEKPEEKSVRLSFKNEIDALLCAIAKAKYGASILWVCNTVNRAQEMYESAVVNTNNTIEIGLIHAQFPLFRRQELEDYWMEKLGKEGKGRCGCILFSTQVVEQSVDLDADFMVSELAPTDMLLQRMGRLWRHKRKKRPCEQPEFCIVSENHLFAEFKKAKADKIKKMFGAKAKVYASYVLLRSFELWKDKISVNLPDDIRDLIEETYKERSGEPKGWQELFKDIKGKDFAKKSLAEFETNVWNILLSDEEGLAKTRINDDPTTQVILAKQVQGRKIMLLNGEIAELGSDAVSLSAKRAIYRNIVRIPAYCFRRKTENKNITALVVGEWQLGIVKEDGTIENQNMAPEYSLKYSPEKGMQIMRNTTANREVTDEPCD